MFDFVLAWMLITNPKHDMSANEVFALRYHVAEIALQLEIIDQREISCYLHRRTHGGGSFDGNIEWVAKEWLPSVQKRYALLHDAPNVNDCERFPDRDTSKAYLDFNKAYHKYLHEQMPHEDSAKWTEWKKASDETAALYNLWDKVYDSKSAIFHVDYRRCCLKEIRDMIGYEAYYSTNLPPPVPAWRFRPID